jgi:hypothetical protein
MVPTETLEKSREHPHRKQNHARGAARRQRQNHSSLEPENSNGRSERKHKRSRIDARKLRCIERKQESTHRFDIAEDGVNGEPNREVENNANDRRRNR